MMRGRSEATWPFTTLGGSVLLVRRVQALSLGLVVQACTSLSVETVLVPEGLQAQSFVVWSEGSAPEAFEGTHRLVVPEGRVFLLAYRDSLEALDLTSGVVTSATCRSCALAAPQGSYELRITAEEVGAWTEVSAPESLLAQLIPDRAERCSSACSKLELVIKLELSVRLPGVHVYGGLAIPERHPALRLTPAQRELPGSDAQLRHLDRHAGRPHPSSHPAGDHAAHT